MGPSMQLPYPSILQLLGEVWRASVMQHNCLRTKGGVTSPWTVTGLWPHQGCGGVVGWLTWWRAVIKRSSIFEKDRLGRQGERHQVAPDVRAAVCMGCCFETSQDSVKGLWVKTCGQTDMGSAGVGFCDWKESLDCLQTTGRILFTGPGSWGTLTTVFLEGQLSMAQRAFLSVFMTIFGYRWSGRQQENVLFSTWKLQTRQKIEGRVGCTEHERMQFRILSRGSRTTSRIQP